uniref:Uncharacterized protein n=1 Tax=Arundo donax TaxID=35708 RepID=A0A0A9EHM8_ARUDO
MLIPSCSSNHPPANPIPSYRYCSTGKRQHIYSTHCPLASPRLLAQVITANSIKSRIITTPRTIHRVEEE